MKDVAKARTRNGGVGELGASQKAEDFPQTHFLFIHLSFYLIRYMYQFVSMYLL